jgi:serine/threonine protein kinase
MILGMPMAPAAVMSNISTDHIGNTASYGSHTAAGQRINDLATQAINATNEVFELNIASKAAGGQLVKQIPWGCLRPVALTKREALIAQGGFSIVLKGILTSSAGNVDVAMKVLTEDYSSSDNYDKLLNDAMEEASITLGIAASMISTEGVVKIFGVASGSLTSDWAKVLNVQNGSSCVAIVMKYEEGGSLANLIYPKRFLELKTKLSFLKSLADVLRQMHGVGGVHGDLKPQNILLSDRVNPMARVADFGLSNIRAAQFGSKTVSTTGGITRGTYRYCAPEMLPNPMDRNAKIEKASASSDIFAFGTVAWELLAQQLPFGDVQTDVDLCAAVWRGERPSLEANVVGLNIPQSVTSLIARCWQEDKALRPDAKQCYEVLSEAYNIVSSQFKDVFFSYCWANKSILKRVLSMMTARGYNIWVDENNMGTYLKDSMREGIANSKVFLACISSNYDSSVNCMFELEYAHQQKKNIIALVLEKFVPYGNSSTAQPGIWTMGQQMDAIVCPRDIAYHPISDVVASWPKIPSEENLKELEDALQGLFKLLDNVNCKPSFPVSQQPASVIRTLGGSLVSLTSASSPIPISAPTAVAVPITSAPVPVPGSVQQLVLAGSAYTAVQGLRSARRNSGIETLLQSSSSPNDQQEPSQIIDRFKSQSGVSLGQDQSTNDAMIDKCANDSAASGSSTNGTAAALSSTVDLQSNANESVLAVGVQSLRTMSLGEIVNRIKGDLGLDASLNVMQVIQTVCENFLSPSQAAELSNLKSTKQKIEYIASFLKLYENT